MAARILAVMQAPLPELSGFWGMQRFTTASHDRRNLPGQAAFLPGSCKDWYWPWVVRAAQIVPMHAFKLLRLSVNQFAWWLSSISDNYFIICYMSKL